MSYQWKAGELAVCVVAMEPWLEVGSIYPICEVDTDLYGLDMTPGIPTGEAVLRLFGVGTPSSWGYGWWKSSRFRPLDASDYQRITEKHKDSLPKRSLVKDDAEARKRIEELTRGTR